MGRPKKAGRKLQSIEECATAMGELLVATAHVEALTAERDLAVAEASVLYEPAIDDSRKQVGELRAALQGYYYGHLSEVEKDGVKHYQFANGVMGRRDDPPALVPKNRAWTWPAVLVALKAKFGDRFLTSKEPVVNKELVKTEIPEGELGDYGLKLERGETFYAEPARLPEVEA
jgi:phage host-nuclease inhibitor protein Gam